jgi:hypothetical protein
MDRQKTVSIDGIATDATLMSVDSKLNVNADPATSATPSSCGGTRAVTPETTRRGAAAPATAPEASSGSTSGVDLLMLS